MSTNGGSDSQTPTAQNESALSAEDEIEFKTYGGRQSWSWVVCNARHGIRRGQGRVENVSPAKIMMDNPASSECSHAEPQIQKNKQTRIYQNITSY